MKSQLQLLLQHLKANYNSITTIKSQLQFYYNYQIPITIQLQHWNPNYNFITIIKSQLQFNYNTQIPITIQLQQ